jgi:PadR family transcriptional regulator
MSSEDSERMAVLQGTLDLIVLRTLDTMGPQHAYAIATRIQQMSEDLLYLNQGTLYPALVRLEQHGRIKGAWGKTDTNREAKFYAITGPGKKALVEETRRWRRMAGLIEKLLSAEA